MRSGGTKLLSIFTLALVGLIVLNVVALHGVRRQYAPEAAAAPLFNISGQVHEWLGYFKKWRSLATENQSLRASIEQRIATQALVESLRIENDMLRKANGLSARLRRDLVPAGIFDVSLNPSGYRALINKGRDAGLADGQAVVSLEGILIGKISAVFPSSSQIILITDPGFSATVRVLSGQASGIARGALGDGIDLELITQSDEIAEGDILVTTGSDLVPAGLVVGTVRNVKDNDTQLFKKVSVNPAMDLTEGFVAVIKP